jgi:hypothetical protein
MLISPLEMNYLTNNVEVSGENLDRSRFRDHYANDVRRFNLRAAYHIKFDYLSKWLLLLFLVCLGREKPYHRRRSQVRRFVEKSRP